MKKFMFRVEATDVDGYATETYQSYSHESEEQARRAVINYCLHDLNIYPRKLTLVEDDSLHSV